MSETFPPCPYLPAPRAAMDHRVFADHGAARDAAFFATALEYGNFLWCRGLAARAILCLDRALCAELLGDEPVLARWPLPYRALAWVLARAPAGTLVGNPRVHYQHLADRLRGPRQEQRAARAWAGWAVTRVVRPELPGDPRHVVTEPGESDVAAALRAHGIAGEAELWGATLTNARAAIARGRLID